MKQIEAVKFYTSHAAYATTQAVFTAADNAAVTLAERLLAEGIGDRKSARPFALLWASAKYGAPIVESQSGCGFTLPQDSAALRHVSRVLSLVFPLHESDPDVWGNKGRVRAVSSKADKVSAAIKLLATLSDAEKKRVKRAMGW